MRSNRKQSRPSLARELSKKDASVLVVERGEPGREASHAAGGMLANCGDETPGVLQALATASAEMYPEFVHELQDESGENVDLRAQGTLLFPGPDHDPKNIPGSSPLPAPMSELEPALSASNLTAVFLKERSICPRALTHAVLKAAKHRGVDISSGTYVLSVDHAEGKIVGVTTDKTSYRAGKVVNCAGAWAGQIAPHPLPTRPVKGQMVCLAMPKRELPRHVVRSPEIYLIPRSDGRLLAGATVEEAGFDKRTACCPRWRTRTSSRTGPDFAPAHATICPSSAKRPRPTTTRPPVISATESSSLRLRHS